MGDQEARPVHEIGGDAAGVEAERVGELAGRDDHRNADGEAVDHRRRYMGDQPPEAEIAGDAKDCAGHQRRQHQAVVAVFVNHARDDDDESAGGAADLNGASAERRDQEPRHDRRDEPLFGRRAGGDGDGDGKRDRHHRHRETRGDIGAQVVKTIGPDAREDLGLAHGCKSRSMRFPHLSAVFQTCATRPGDASS